MQTRDETVGSHERRRGPGSLIVICGCMFSGKTGRLIELLEAERAAGWRVVACKHQLDARYDATRLATHDGRSFTAVAAADAAQVLARATGADVVGIDEAQFFGRALVDVCRTLVKGGKTVVVVGIDHDTWGQPFPPLPELKALADEVEQRYASCAVCGAPAEFHQRMVPVIGGNLVGGPGEFEPRCAEHFTPLPPPAPVYE
jgi:thymidine kinase